MNEAWVTGSSMLTSAGIGNDAVWEAVMAEKPVIGERRQAMGDGSEDVRFPCYVIGSVDLAKWLEPQQCEKLKHWGVYEDYDFSYILVSILLALHDAELSLDAASRVSLVVGHENLGVVRLVDRLVHKRETIVQAEKGFRHSFAELQHYFYHLQTFPYLFYLSNLFGINGLTYAVNNACASGLYATELGRQLLASGSTDVVIVACSDYAHASEYLWLEDKGAMSGGAPLAPFDLNRQGSVLGDGAGALVLETREHAERRGAKASCFYAGGSFAQERWQMTLPDVSSHLYASVIADAVQRFAPDGVDLHVPHGTGSPLWDLYEAREIQRAYRSSTQALPPVTAFKGYMGHTLGASGMLESVLLIEAMKRGVIPRTLQHHTPDPKLSLPIVTETSEKRIRTAVKSVPAYGGFHAACIWKSTGKREEP
ncbi:beta-ketoacyl synthase [Xylanibacillus composti]|uniref:Beta-ketoacyl synthase n=1 Tax=Xylanibacillus composti TaxID=1572762 RepID=A0A8J4M4Q4_9BACL|nr:beta-ketoacyl synthase N-terminal-like domain-containing protein [Xylanibacillus composti]MDT9726759.1 beta-ketoacyl synthase [Xylanibacillus composti]GIQ71465.1 beta-ketoacyl synthase [Xylanibacillus composti]